jgi:hypothetical protein
VNSFLLLQTGDYLLLQTGDKLLLQLGAIQGAAGAAPSKKRRRIQKEHQDFVISFLPIAVEFLNDQES